MLTESKADVHNIHIKDAGHFFLTDLGLSSLLLTDMLNGQIKVNDNRYCLRVINELCLGFFDSYLKEKGEFISYID